MLPRLVIGHGFLRWFVVGQRGLLMAVDLTLLLLQEGGGGGSAAAYSIWIHVLSPIVRPTLQQIPPPPFHQHLDLCSALIVHGTLSHEASVSGTMGMLWRAAGGRGGHT